MEYYWFRLALGLIGTLAWLMICAREYKYNVSISKRSFNRRLQMMMLVSFPLIYSVGYSIIFLDSLVAGRTPSSNTLPLLIAASVQGVADLYGVTLVTRWTRDKG